MRERASRRTAVDRETKTKGRRPGRRSATSPVWVKPRRTGCGKKTPCGGEREPDEMYQRVYPTQGRKPAEELHLLLAETRVRHDRFKVTLGSPPFERDGLDKIIGIRLRFMPAGSVGTGSAGATSGGAVMVA